MRKSGNDLERSSLSNTCQPLSFFRIRTPKVFLIDIRLIFMSKAGDMATWSWTSDPQLLQLALTVI